MTDSDLITYFSTHPLDIQEYNIADNGTVTLKMNKDGEKNIPQDIKDYIATDPLNFQGVVRLGYPGKIDSSGHKKNASASHAREASDICNGALPRHGYGSGSQALDKNTSMGIDNPSKSSKGRLLPTVLTRVLCHQPIDITTSNLIFYARDEGTEHEPYTFIEGRNRRYNQDMSDYFSIYTYRFCCNICISLVHQHTTYNGMGKSYKSDHNLLNIMLPYFAGERDRNSSTGRYIGNAISI